MTLSEIERGMSALAPYRRPALFNDFLIQGYMAITLSSVPQTQFSNLLQAKLCLGTIITLYDDFADRPSQCNPQLLEILYQLDFVKCQGLQSLNIQDRQVIAFAECLFSQIAGVLSPLPHRRRFGPVLDFDLAQFYSANRYSSLVTANPFINNAFENRAYGHHNMGMVMVSMMDLMAIEQVEFSEIGAIREIFLLGQRMGRIFNVLATRKREIADGDVTGELATYSERETKLVEKRLHQEICDLCTAIEGFAPRITTFSVTAYLAGLMKVQKLHERLEGVI